MKGIDALAGPGGFAVGGVAIGVTEIHADRLQLGAAGFAQFVVEGLQGGGIMAFPGPDHRAVAVMVSHHRQEARTFAVGNLIDPDAIQAGEPIPLEVLSHHLDHGLATVSQLTRSNLVTVVLSMRRP